MARMRLMARSRDYLFLLILQRVQEISKTRNQFIRSGPPVEVRRQSRIVVCGICSRVQGLCHARGGGRTAERLGKHPLHATLPESRTRPGCASPVPGGEEALRAHHWPLLRETPMDDARAPDALLDQSLAVLRQCFPTLETAAAQAPHVAPALQETLTALRGVEQALHQQRDVLRRAHHFATLGRLAAGLTHEIRNPLGVLFLHIDLLEEEFRDPSSESATVIA